MRKAKGAGAHFGGRLARPLDRETLRFGISFIARWMRFKNEKGFYEVEMTL